MMHGSRVTGDQRILGSGYFSTMTAAKPSAERPVCTVVIDAEEDFDWGTPVQGTSHSTANMANVKTLNTIFDAYGLVPAYLLTYPVLEDREVVRIIRRQIERGSCVIGIQLHPWVTPPFAGPPTARSSFAANLGDDLEERKLVALTEKFAAVFGFAPRVYRAGRYGLSTRTAGLLEKHGFTIDTSVAPRTSFIAEEGPDYTEYDCQPFWFGERRSLLEVPLCRSVVGWAGLAAPALYRRMTGPRLTSLHVPSILTRSRCAERITLSPEGNDIAAMHRLVRGLRHRGQGVLPLSFHSSSLRVGRNPYVQSRADLHAFYDRLSAMLDWLASDIGCQFANIEQIPSFLVPPLPRPA